MVDASFLTMTVIEMVVFALLLALVASAMGWAGLRGGMARGRARPPAAKSRTVPALPREETVSQAVARLGRRGYGDDFRASMSGLDALAAGRSYEPEELAVDEVVRFEGMTDPDDQAILFAVRARDGVKGTYTVPYGAAMAQRDIEMVQRLGRGSIER